MDVVSLTQKLIACPSVTPRDAGAQALLGTFLQALGFTCHPLTFNGVPNLFARIGTTSPHLCFSGHTDVVPAGPEDLWTYGPFTPHIADGILYGRGASDMKGAVAAFAIAARDYLADTPLNGSISLLITGDEEGPAQDGTVRVLEWMRNNGHLPDMALGGEPTNPSEIGQEIKIGRRGSLTGHLRVTGKQGHVAYPHLADNPLPRLVRFLGALSAHVFDTGTAFFPATNLEIVTMDGGGTAENVIPASGHATFNIRFNDQWTSQSLTQTLHDILRTIGGPYDLETTCGAESFITQPGPWPERVQSAIAHVTGKTPAYTTNGGTSDARFFAPVCPVVECGAVNATIHQINEHARVSDLHTLTQIYRTLLEKTFGI